MTQDQSIMCAVSMIDACGELTTKPDAGVEPHTQENTRHLITPAILHLQNSISAAAMSHDEHHHPPAAPLDLLDECWFFSNTLNNGANKKKPPLLPKSPSTSSSSTTNIEPSSGSAGQGFGCRRRLLRTPSLPSPRIIPAQPSRPYSSNKEHEEEEQAEVDDDDLNWSSIYEGILRSRITAASSSSSHKGLQRAPSMPVVPSSTDSGRSKEEMITPSSRNKLRHSYSTLERHTSIKQQQTPRSSGRSKQKQQQQPAMMMARSKNALFHAEAADKKWKSSSDLESIEVQGFKDLGFVFDKVELKEDLADVLPGLNKNASSGHGAVRRPYLSEAWHNDRRPPALIRVQSSEARSAAEMKDQLRMWAQAVACNARQECV